MTVPKSPANDYKLDVDACFNKMRWSVAILDRSEAKNDG